MLTIQALQQTEKVRTWKTVHLSCPNTLAMASGIYRQSTGFHYPWMFTCSIIFSASAFKTKMWEGLTVQDIYKFTGDCLKYAPDRHGGGGSIYIQSNLC